MQTNFYLKCVLLFVCLVEQVFTGAVQMNNANADSILGGAELTFVNFYANWCRFSQMLEPIYDEFADKVAKEFPPSKVQVAKVDCDTETTLATDNHINKYPSLKLYRYGVPVKKEYRGARTADAFLDYIREQIASPVKKVTSASEYHQLENKKRTIIGYFENEQNENYLTYAKLTSILRDSCVFVAATGDLFAYKRVNGDSIVFRNIGGQEHQDIPFSGALNQYETLYAWANEKCTPLVREITFENAEELTEEGLPFLILFHRPDDLNSIKIYEAEVQRQLSHDKNSINPVYADGLKFSHPLNHLGKSASDLPIIAIDSFRHMYLFPDFKKLTEGNHLKQFVMDLNSGKLHREFHNGPDPTTETPKEIEAGGPEHVPNTDDNDHSDQQRRSTPPESVFIKLTPSSERYSMKHTYDEEL